MTYPTNQYVNFQGINASKKENTYNFKHLLKELLDVFEIGIFEIVFILVILSVIFGLLNYFNILSLSKIYKPLGALPRILPTPSPLPLPTPFVYDKNASTTLLSLYTSQILVGSYEFLISKSDPKNTQQFQNIFTYSWGLDDKTTLQGKIFNKIDSHDYDYLQLSVQSASTSAIPQNATASAQQILSNYFKPYAGTAPLTCTFIQGLPSCEQFSTTSFGDIGQGIIFNRNSTYLVFVCRIFPNSTYHQIKRSCIPLL